MIAEGKKVEASVMHEEVMRILAELKMPMDPLFREFMSDIADDAADNTVGGLHLSMLEMMYQRAINYRTLTQEDE